MVDIKILNKIKSDIYAENYVAVKNNIRKLLEESHKTEYQNLALKLLNVDIYKKDTVNSRTIIFLKKLNEDKLLENLYKRYLIKFYNCLNYQNNLYAKINLEVIEELEQLGCVKEERYLPSSFRKYLNQKDNLEYFKQIMPILKQDGCYLSEIFSELKLKELQNEAMNYPNLETSIIKTKEGKQLLVRYVLSESINENEVINKGKEALKNNNLTEALEYFQRLSQKNGTVLNYIYANLGLIHLKLQHSEQALKFLTIATYKKGSKHYKFQNIISQLKPLNLNLKEKPKLPVVKLEEFTNTKEYNNKYQKIINNFNESNNNLMDICKKYNMTKKDYLIIKILIARHYYANYFNEYGDRVLKQIEKDPFNDHEISNLIKETRINKQFYQNQRQYQTMIKLKL